MWALQCPVFQIACVIRTGPGGSIFKPADIVKQLNLLRPIFSKTTNYGHFGKVDDLDAITWEKTNKAAALRKALK